MKKIKRTLLVSFITLLGGGVFLSSFVTYIFLNDSSQGFYIVAFFLLVITGISFYLYKKIVTKLSDDIEAVHSYLDAINKKKYDSVVKINTFKELLQITMVLKNIVKRLSQKKSFKK